MDDKPHSKPNVLIIYTDDQAQWTIGAYGNKDVHTPNMDRLASEGMLFTRALTKPVCSPSRAMLLTGLFSHKVGIPDYISYPDTNNTGLPFGTQTIASLLKGAGYRTGLVGKWHLGYGEKYYPTLYGFDHAEDYRYIAPDKKIAAVGKIPFLIDGKEIEGFRTDPQHMDILADRAINFIRAQQERPFLLYFSTYMPHQPWDSVPKVDRAYYENKILKVPDLSSFQEIIPERATPEQLQNIMRKYYANVTCVDRNIGRVLDELDLLGLSENTIVIFMGDNGYMVSHHGLLGKGNARSLYIDESESYPGRKYGTRANMFDNSVLVPLIIRWPGVVKSGTINNVMVSTLDILPTLSEINGLTPEDMKVDGKSLLPFLRGNSDKNWRSA